MLYEDDLVAAVVAHLLVEGWMIENTAIATQHGDDIVATRDSQRLVVEGAKAAQRRTQSDLASHSAAAKHAHTLRLRYFVPCGWHQKAGRPRP